VLPDIEVLVDVTEGDPNLEYLNKQAGFRCFPLPPVVREVVHAILTWKKDETRYGRAADAAARATRQRDGSGRQICPAPGAKKSGRQKVRPPDDAAAKVCSSAAIAHACFV
jgi:hypothetical protein